MTLIAPETACVTKVTDITGSRDHSGLLNRRGFTMTPNVGTIDRSIRIVAGIALIVLAALGKIGPWGYIGIVPLATGVFRFCPAYRLIGMTTCPLASRKA